MANCNGTYDGDLINQHAAQELYMGYSKVEVLSQDYFTDTLPFLEREATGKLDISICS